MPFIGVQVSPEMKARFDRLAELEGGKSALLRRMLEAAVGQASAEEPGRVASGASGKITVRFRESERAAIADAAVARGMTRPAWIASLVRARLAHGLPLSVGEEAALRAIARELSRIGGNVNQMARAANMQVMNGGPVSVGAEMLEAACSTVGEALRELRQVLARSAGYWQAPR